MSVERATLSWGEGEIVFDGGTLAPENGLYIAKAGIEGFYSTPQLKVDAVERGNGDGAHRVVEQDIHYAQRTVLVHYLAFGSARQQILDAIESLGQFTHKIVTFRLQDGERDTFVRGYVMFDVDSLFEEGATSPATLTIVCDQPTRLSTRTTIAQLVPSFSGASGGLSYGLSMKGLAYPINYGEEVSSGANVVMVHNAGTSTAFPVLTAYGDFNFLRISWGGKTLEYAAPIGAAPLVLDGALNGGSATIGGADMSRFLRYRSFPQIPPGGDITLVLESTGTGFVNVETHDAYM